MRYDLVLQCFFYLFFYLFFWEERGGDHNAKMRFGRNCGNAHFDAAVVSQNIS